jgi:hypothetical protein
LAHLTCSEEEVETPSEAYQDSGRAKYEGRRQVAAMKDRAAAALELIDEMRVALEEQDGRP